MLSFQPCPLVQESQNLLEKFKLLGQLFYTPGETEVVPWFLGRTEVVMRKFEPPSTTVISWLFSLEVLFEQGS